MCLALGFSDFDSWAVYMDGFELMTFGLFAFSTVCTVYIFGMLKYRSLSQIRAPHHGSLEDELQFEVKALWGLPGFRHLP